MQAVGNLFHLKKMKKALKLLQYCYKLNNERRKFEKENVFYYFCKQIVIGVSLRQL